MNRKNSFSTNEILRRFIRQAESYNRCKYSRENSKENLVADVVSNEFRCETSPIEFNSISSCCLISIVSPDAFSIELTGDLAESDAFFKSMNEFYNSIDDLQIPVEYFRRDLLCVTWDDKSCTWNRSQILEFDLIDETVNVFFVDLNVWEEHVARSRLRFILTKFSSRPVRLLTCRLASIGPSNDDDEKWNDVELKTFRNVIENYRCDVEFLNRTADGTFSVNLFAWHDETYVCVNEFLVHCQMARRRIDENSRRNRIDENERMINPIISLYWKSGELMKQNVKKTFDTVKFPQLTKTIFIEANRKIIFVKYRSFVMVPCFSLSSFLRRTDSIEPSDLKPIVIDPLSDPLLCSQLLKLNSSKNFSTRISLFSIDSARKILSKNSEISPKVFDVLRRARLAEATDDETFWQIE